MIQWIYSQVEEKTVNHSVKELCTLYGVSRSGYYKWSRRKYNFNTYQLHQQQLDVAVKDIHNHYPSMGYRQIRDTLLHQTGIKISDPSVWRSMKRLGISGYVRRTSCPAPSGKEHNCYANILERKFSAKHPCEKIVTDVTYIRNQGNWYYLCCYLDLYNNEIVEWELREKFDNFLVIHPAKRLLEKIKSTAHPILLHSDQGVQYSSAGYCSLLKEYNIIQSMSRAGTPRDNAVIESFFGRFKDVLRSHYEIESCEDIRDTISEAIAYFNYRRPLRKLNGKPPVPYRMELTA